MRGLSLFLVFFLVVVLFSSFVSSSISMSPAGPYRLEYDERLGIQDEFVVMIRSSASQTILVGVTKDFKLTEFVEVDKMNFTLEPGQGEVVTIKVDIPPNLDFVGSHESWITFRMGVPDSAGMMGFTTGVAARVIVAFSYPGEYISISHLDNPVHIGEGEDAVIGWEVRALGMEVTSFVNSMSIKDGDGVEVFFKEYPMRFLERNKVFVGETEILSSDFLPGSYVVVFNSTSANNSDSRVGSFRIGEADVALKSFSPSNFTLGSVVGFSFVVESLWNQEFSNVYAVLEVNGSSTTTKSFNMRPFEEVLIDKQFIDLSELGEGVHEGSLTIFFGDSSKSFDVEFLGLVPKSDMNVIWVLVVVGVLIIVGVLSVFLFKIVNKKDDKKKK